MFKADADRKWPRSIEIWLLFEQGAVAVYAVEFQREVGRLGTCLEQLRLGIASFDELADVLFQPGIAGHAEIDGAHLGLLERNLFIPQRFVVGQIAGYIEKVW